MEDKDKSNTWRWMKKNYLKGFTKTFICMPRKSLYKLTISSTIFTKLTSRLFVWCVLQWDLVSVCDKLTQKEYKWGYDSVGRYVYWQFCEKLGSNRIFWFEHEPESAAENKHFKIIWDFTIQCDHMIEARRPDIVVVDKVKTDNDYWRSNARR